MTAGARGSDNWQQVPLSVTCWWVMNTQVNEMAGGTRKHGVKQGNWRYSGRHLENGIQMRSNSLAVVQSCSVVALIWPHVKKSPAFTLCSDIQTCSYSMWVCFLFIPVTSWPIWLWQQCKMENVWPLRRHKQTVWWGDGALSRLSCRGSW